MKTNLYLRKEEVSDYLTEKREMISFFNSLCKRIDLSEKKILLINVPSDSNLGDHAQTLCIIKLLNDIYPDANIIEIPTMPYAYYNDLLFLFSRINMLLNQDDLIVFHSGYHINDIYCNKYGEVAPTCYAQMAAMNAFSNNRVFFFPQTINFTRKTDSYYQYIDTIKKQQRVTLLCRDERSFEIANTLFGIKRTFLMPDVVTTLIGNVEFTKTRNKKVLLAFRDFKQNESLLDSVKVELIEKTLRMNGVEYEFAGTKSSLDGAVIRKNREKVIYDKIKEFSSYSAVITDLYHGMIFSVIANTPVFVMKSSDHKISSGIRFFGESPQFDNLVFYSESIEDLVDKIRNYQIGDVSATRIEPYFMDKYYRDISDLLRWKE